MKALLYKEFKLAVHPLIYLFIFVFPLMVLIPSYPIYVSFIYLMSAYPILFLGANKGQQSNDLLFSTLLPVRKKDIVLARILTVVIIQVVFILVMSALYPLSIVITESAKAAAEAAGKTFEAEIGLGIYAYVSVLGIVIAGFSIADLIFFPIYYKNGKSIVLSTLLTILGFVLFIAIFTIMLPYIPVVGDAYKSFLTDNIGIQFALLGAGILISIALHFLTYKIASKQLEKVDF